MKYLVDLQAVIDIVNFECGKWQGLARTIVKEIKDLPAIELENNSVKLQHHSYLQTEKSDSDLFNKEITLKDVWESISDEKRKSIIACISGETNKSKITRLRYVIRDLDRIQQLVVMYIVEGIKKEDFEKWAYIFQR